MMGVTLARFAGLFLGLLLLFDFAAWLFRSAGPSLDPLASLFAATAAGQPLYHRGWAKPPLTFTVPCVVASFAIALAIGALADVVGAAAVGAGGAAVSAVLAPWFNPTTQWMIYAIGLNLTAIVVGYLLLAPKMAKV
ncbi:MAG: hypothetical protein AAFV26_08475 [Pseudomonadota bacterium]